MKKKIRILWITDPWDYLDHPKDTTLRLIEESMKLGFHNEWCSVRSIHYCSERGVQVEAFSMTFPSSAVPYPQLHQAQLKCPLEFDSIQFRMDPPVDASYEHPLQLLLLSVRKKLKRFPSLITNPPQVLLHYTEKTISSLLPELCPSSLISSQWGTLSSFGKKHQITVLKPLNSCQSKGVEKLLWTTNEEILRSHAFIEKTTRGFREPVLLQQFLEDIQHGELRLWFLDGNLLSSICKLPIEGDFRVNTDRGSQLQNYTLTPSEKKISQKISQVLMQMQIRLAAVDLIGGKITDFNFTSPGLLRQTEKITGRNLAREIMIQLASPYPRAKI